MVRNLRLVFDFILKALSWLFEKILWVLFWVLIILLIKATFGLFIALLGLGSDD